MAMKIGKPLFKKMADHPGSGKAQDGSVAAAAGVPDYISSDCPLGGHHIAQGFEVNQLGNPTLAHPLTLVRMAYGMRETPEDKRPCNSPEKSPATAS
jgi:glycerol-3-phosphate dehydrogenase subunit C